MFEGLFQPMHLIIIAFIVVVIFGGGKLAGVGGALGKSIKEFKQATTDDDYQVPTTVAAGPTAAVAASAPVRGTTVEPASDEVARLREEIEAFKASMKTEPAGSEK
jgi:TatA/E family protein of Tat protein translocase